MRAFARCAKYFAMLPSLSLTILIGGLGGWAAKNLHVPMGWMIGAIFATGAVSLAGVKLKMPGPLRWLVLSVIGLYVGLGIDDQVISWLGNSIYTITIMLALVTIQTLLAGLLLRALVGCTWATSLTSCVPGGFSTMLAIAREFGGDEEMVAVIQLIRVVFVVTTVSLLARHMGMEVLDTSLEEAAIATFKKTPVWQGAYTILGAGFIIGLITKFPIVFMIAPMLIAGITNIMTGTTLSLPDEPLSLALVVLGSAIGARFNILRTKKLGMCLLGGTVLSVFLIVTSAGCAWTAAKITGYDFLPVLLALSPGGVSEINLIAIANDIEPAFVSLHHLIRVIFIFLTVPIVLIAIRKSSASRIGVGAGA